MNVATATRFGRPMEMTGAVGPSTARDEMPEPAHRHADPIAGGLRGVWALPLIALAMLALAVARLSAC